MKKVVIGSNEAKVESACIIKYYGAKTNAYKGFIKSTTFNSYEFGIFTPENFTNSNYICAYLKKETSISSYLRFLINGGVEVYEFDKLSELALWLEN